MTSYRTKEEVEKLYEAIIKSGAEVTTHQDSMERSYTFKEIQLMAFRNELRLSDLESIIEAVESMKFEGDLAESSERRHNTAIDSVLSYLKSLKQ